MYRNQFPIKILPHAIAHTQKRNSAKFMLRFCHDSLLHQPIYIAAFIPSNTFAMMRNEIQILYVYQQNYPLLKYLLTISCFVELNQSNKSANERNLYLLRQIIFWLVENPKRMSTSQIQYQNDCSISYFIFML